MTKKNKYVKKAGRQVDREAERKTRTDRRRGTE